MAIMVEGLAIGDEVPCGEVVMARWLSAWRKKSGGSDGWPRSGSFAASAGGGRWREAVMAGDSRRLGKKARPGRGYRS